MTMSTIGATASVQPGLLPGSGGVGIASPAGAPLLPAPAVAFDVGDALTELMKLGSALSEEQTKGSMNSAASASGARKAASEKRMQALADAVEAARKAQEARSSGGLFDILTDNLGPAGLLGLCTGAAYIVAADALAHASGLDDRKLDLADAAGVGAMMMGPVGVAVYAAQLLVKKYGPEELQKGLDQGPSLADEKTRLANKLVFSAIQAQLAIALTVATGGTAAPAVVACVGIAISTTTQLLNESGVLEKVFKDDAKWVALGGSLTGAAVGLGGGIATIASAGAISLVNTAATSAKSGLEAVHDINQGIRNLDAASHARDADKAHIEAQHQKQVLELIERMIGRVIEDMTSIKESAQKTTEILQATIQTKNQTVLGAGTMKA